MPIVSKIIGGLGNQMFQYAMGRSIAVRHQTDLYLDTSLFNDYGLHNGFELDRVFDLNVKVISRHELKKLFGWKALRTSERLLSKKMFSFLRGANYYNENGVEFNDRFYRLPSKCYVTGYWQSERYFEKIENIIRSEFVFNKKLSGRNAELAEKIGSANSVSLHVRRGDYISDKLTNDIIGACPIEYYIKSIEYIENTVENPEYFIFSDDMEWVKSNLRIADNIHYITNNNGINSWMDMNLISMCNHHIIANSTFSWWGAWLCDNPFKTVVAPKRWYRANTLVSKDILPGSWVKL